MAGKSIKPRALGAILAVFAVGTCLGAQGFRPAVRLRANPLAETGWKACATENCQPVAAPVDAQSWAAMIARLRAQLERDPSDRTARDDLRRALDEESLLRGRQEMRAGHWREAETLFRMCLDYEPEDARARSALQQVESVLSRLRQQESIERQCRSDLAAGDWTRLLRDAQHLREVQSPGPGVIALEASEPAAVRAVLSLSIGQFAEANAWIRNASAADRSRLDAFARYQRWRWYWLHMIPVWGCVYLLSLVMMVYSGYFWMSVDAMPRDPIDGACRETAG